MARLQLQNEGLSNQQYTMGRGEDRDVVPGAHEIFRKRIASHLVRIGVEPRLIDQVGVIFEGVLAQVGSPDAAVARCFGLLDGVFGVERIGAAHAPLANEVIVEWLAGGNPKAVIGIAEDVGARLGDDVPRATRRAVVARLITMYRANDRQPFAATVVEECARLMAARKRAGKVLGTALAGSETDLVEAWEESTKTIGAVLSKCVDRLIAAHEVASRPRKSPMAQAFEQARVHAS